jgi:drug/metabolite transporter (DMT)-like permease
MTLSTPKNTHANRGYILAIFSAFLLSLTGILIRFLTTTYQLPALILAFWRALMVFITLFLCLVIIKPGLLKLPTKNLPYLALYGFVLALFNSSWTISVATNGAAVATVMVYCSAAFTALLAWLFLRESLGWGKLLAVVLSLGGCLLVSDALNLESWSANFVGLASGILAGLLYAVYSLMGRSASQRGINPWTTMVYIFGFDALFLFAFNLLPIAGIPGSSQGLQNLIWSSMDWIGWVVLFILAAVPTLFGFGTYMISLSYLPSSVVNLLATLEPVFTAILAYVCFSEKLNLVQLGGAVLILGGVVVIRLTEGLRRNDPKLNPVPAEK